MAGKRKAPIKVSPSLPIVQFLYREALNRDDKARARLAEPVSLFCEFFAKRVESKLFGFHVETPWDNAHLVADQEIAKAYNAATGRPVISVMRMHVKELTRNTISRDTTSVRNQATFVNIYGRRVWHDPYSRDEKIVGREKDDKPAYVDKLHERLWLYLEQPLRERLYHVPDVNAAALVAETITEFFYLFFRAALDGGDARLVRLTPFIGLLIKGIIPIGDRIGPDMQPACVVLID